MSRDGRNFTSDNVTGVAPAIMEAILAANRGRVPSYGVDPITRRLTALAAAVFETEVAIFPVATGTAANALASRRLLARIEHGNLLGWPKKTGNRIAGLSSDEPRVGRSAQPFTIVS